jgi:hypothetical protein
MTEIDIYLLTALYEEVIVPRNLLEVSEVEEYLRGAEKDEIEAFLQACIKYECYEHAKVASLCLKNCTQG